MCPGANLISMTHRKQVCPGETKVQQEEAAGGDGVGLLSCGKFTEQLGEIMRRK